MENMTSMGFYFLLWFSFYSVVGWVYESCFCSITQKKLINRGFLYGCYCPIYGVAAVIGIGFLEGMKSNIAIFLWGMVVASILEFVTSWVLEEIFHARWWDYTERKVNLQGRVCLEGALFFGAMLLILVRVVHPFVERVTMGIAEPFIDMATGAVLAILIMDTILTVIHLNKFNQKLKELHEKAEACFVATIEAAEDKKQIYQDALEARKKISGLELQNLRETVFVQEGKLLMARMTTRERRLLKTFPKFRSNRHKEGLEKLRELLRKKME